MTIEERVAEVLSFESTKKTWRTKFTSDEWVKASRLNRDLFGIPLNKARRCGCIEDLFFMLQRMSPEKLNQLTLNKMSQFKLNPNKVISVHNMADSITSANCTDEKAIALLKMHKGHIKNFAEYPANWEEIVDGNAKLETENETGDAELLDLTPKKPTREELRARAKAVGLKTTATLEQIEAAEAAKQGE